MGSRWLRAALVWVLTLGCALVTGCSKDATGAFEPVDGPVVAVLCQMSREVVLLDPVDLSELQRVKLSSQALDLDVMGRRLITAQCGGHGDEMGREYGMLDLERGDMNYTKLGSMDTQTAAATHEGWFMLTTGLVGPEGHWLHRVDCEGKVEDLWLSPGVAGCTGTRDRVWVWHHWDDESGSPTDGYYVYSAAGTPQPVASEMTLTVSLCGFETEVVAFGRSNADARLVRYAATDARVLGEALVGGFETGPAFAWAAGRYVAIADGPLQDTYAAQRLVFVDAVSLERVGALPVRGVSSVSNGPDGGVLVAQGDGTLTHYDADLQPVASTKVGDPQGEIVDLAYVP